MKQLELDNYNC